ncbi:MAG: aldehyde dehydrogenase family protein [Deltaproteobacteria bacterium]|nr:aldehyde dehydrogenase family protein [Deltaproteobacteria bacterium]
MSHPLLPRLGDYIGGAFYFGEGVPSRFSTNPATGARVAEGAPREGGVEQAVAAARAALPGWRRAGLEARAEALRAVAARVGAHQARIAEAITAEMGKPASEALGEAASVKSKIEGTIAQLAHTLPPAPPGAPGEQRFHPLGVVAIIGPFNFPVHLLNTHVIPALLTGNTVVLKPSEVTPLAAQRYVELFHDAGLPPGVLNLVQGGGAEGGALAAHPGVQGVIFTGSYETGRRIREVTFDQPAKKVCLELGGKNPALVLDDAHIEQAAREVMLGALLTTGQRCTATSRVLVTRAAAEPLRRALVEGFKRALPSDPARPDCLMGPLATLASKERFMRLLAQGRAEGARVLVESVSLGGAFVTPSLYEVTGEEPYLREELFGPHVALQVVADEDAAFEWAARSEYGLSASVFSARPEALEALYDRVPAGVLNWNRSTNGASGLLPFGGVNKSGNWHPAGSEGPRLSTYAVAVMSVPFGALTPHKELDALLRRDPLARLELQHRAEEVVERFGLWLEPEAGGLRLPFARLKVRVGAHLLSGEALAARAREAGLSATAEGAWLDLDAPALPDPERVEDALLSFLTPLVALDPEPFLARPRRELLAPKGGVMPRSSYWLERFYGGTFLPREKKSLVADLARSQGPYLRSVDDRPLQIIDAASQIASLPGGFRPDQAQAALDEGRLDPYLPSCAQPDEAGAGDVYERLAAEMLLHAPPAARHVCWVNGGAEANEKAFHLAKLHYGGGRRVLAFEGAFHGRTLLSLYCTWNKTKRAAYELKGHEAVFLKRPLPADPYADPALPEGWFAAWRAALPADLSAEGVVAARAGLKEAAGVEREAGGAALLAEEVDRLVEVELALRAGDVMACIIEPHQCEGGDASPTRRFFHALRALTRAYGAALIFDEVQSGFGLSGPIFWHERFALRDAEGAPEGPDFVTGAKRAQVGYVLSPYPDPDPSPAHALSAARGVEHLRLLADHPPHEALAREQLKALAEKWPQVVTRPRAFGDAFGFDLPTADIANHLINQRFYRGYMVYIAGERTLRYRLSRGFSPREVREVFGIIDRSIEALVAQAGGAGEQGGEPLVERMSRCKAPAWVDSHEHADGDLPATLAEILSVPGEADLHLKRAGELTEEERARGEAALGLPASRAEADARALSDADPRAFMDAVGFSLTHFAADRLGTRIKRVTLAEFERYADRIRQLEEDVYEPARCDDVETLRAIAAHPDGVACVAEDLEGLVGVCFASPLEEWEHITGPREDPNRGLHNTLYSADITIDARGRGLGVGHRLRGAVVREALRLRRPDGAPRYAFITGRNRVGEANAMWAINQRWGAYVVHTYDNQYDQVGAQARYYRVPLRRFDRRGLPLLRAEVPAAQAWGLHQPTGASHPLLERARDLGVFDEGALTKITVSNFITPAYARYAELLRHIAPRGCAHLYFTSCLDEQVDKAIRSLKHNRSAAQVALSFEGARFGSTTAANRSLSDLAAGEGAGAGKHFDWPTLPHPNDDLPAALAALRAAVDAAGGPSGVIGLFVEAIQGRTGRVLSDAAWEALCAWRDETGIPLVLSEVNSGFGRSGRGFWWLDGARGDADVVMWWAGGQVGHIFVSPRVFVPTPLTLISTWDGEDLSGTRLLYQVYATRQLDLAPLSAWLDATLAARFGASAVGGAGLFRVARHPAAARVQGALAAAGVQVQRLGDALQFAPPLTLSAEDRAAFERALDAALA